MLFPAQAHATDRDDFLIAGRVVTNSGRFIGVYRLPFAPVFDEACSGLAVTTRLGGTEGRVILPTVFWREDESPYIGPPPSQAPRKVIESLRGDESWGQVGTWHQEQHTVYGWSAHMVTLSWPIARAENAEDVADGLFTSIGTWSARLADWIEAATDQDAERVGPLSYGGTEGEGLLGWSRTGLGIGWHSPSHITVISRDVTPIDRRLWRRLLRTAAEHGAVPEEHRLLSDARAWLRRGEFRRAAIDAGTAAELVLAELLDRELRKIPGAIGSGLGGENRPLGRLVKLVGPVLPVKMADMEGLVKVRNQAVHKNYLGNRSESSTAIKTAEALVAVTNPIRSLLG